jgi:hypothetical protein
VELTDVVDIFYLFATTQDTNELFGIVKDMDVWELEFSATNSPLP